MGANVSSTSVVRSSTNMLPTSYLGELGSDIEYDRSMSNSRFLKTIKARQIQNPHSNHLGGTGGGGSANNNNMGHGAGAGGGGGGSAGGGGGKNNYVYGPTGPTGGGGAGAGGAARALVVKVYLKQDPGLSLRNYAKKLKHDKEALADVPNILAYTRVLETEKAGYLIRPWHASSLYDRISTRPFLTQIEKKWIAFQLLVAMKDARERKISHGDIKSENILITSSLHLYLTDLSPFKPTYLPDDDPSLFSYFYDLSSRRTCYLSPERFYPPGSEIARKKEEVRKKEMGISVGSGVGSPNAVGSPQGRQRHFSTTTATGGEGDNQDTTNANGTGTGAAGGNEDNLPPLSSGSPIPPSSLDGTTSPPPSAPTILTTTTTGTVTPPHSPSPSHNPNSHQPTHARRTSHHHHHHPHHITLKRDGKVREEMDAFSVGCVIGEMWREGKGMCSLSEVLGWRKGEWGPELVLEEIEDEGIRSLVKSLISLNPAHRPTFNQALQTYRSTCFPDYFYTHFYDFSISINDIVQPVSNDPIFGAGGGTGGVSTTAAGMQTGIGMPGRSVSSGAGGGGTPTTGTTLVPGGAGGGTGTPTSVNAAASPLGYGIAGAGGGNDDPLSGQGMVYAADADERIERVWVEFEEVGRRCFGNWGEEIDGGDLGGGANREEEDEDIDGDGTAGKKGKYGPVKKGRKVRKENRFSLFPLQLHIPNYEIELPDEPMLGGDDDGAALILLSLICANLRNCTRATSTCKAIDLLLALSVRLSNETKVDRVLPYLVSLFDSDAPVVRTNALIGATQLLALVGTLPPSNASLFTEYVLPNIQPFVNDPEVSVRCAYAACMGSLSQTGMRFLEITRAMRADGILQVSSSHEESYDLTLQDLQLQLQEPINSFLIDPSPSVKRSLLFNIGQLCTFFGRSKTNDVLLSHIITYLNDREDWMLREAFFESMVHIASCIGGKSIEDFLLPLLTQSLSDVEDFVISKAIDALEALARLGLFQKARIIELAGIMLGFLCHPDIWIRQGAARFIATVGGVLSTTDTWCILYPALRRMLRADIKELDSQSLLATVERPVPRPVFEAAVAWAGRAQKSGFWVDMRRAAPGARPEDEKQLAKLRQLGMNDQDEFKLHIMREYIKSLAVARQRSGANPPTQNGATFTLQDLGITPETIFFNFKDESVISSRQAQSRLHSVDSWPRRPAIEVPRSPASMDLNHNRISRGLTEGQALDDLRRKLTRVGGSTTSLPSVTSPVLGPSPVPSDGKLPHVSGLASPTLSEAHSDSPFSVNQDHPKSQDLLQRHRSRMTVNGVELGRGSPAVGQDTTNAMATIDVEGRYANQDDDAASGITTPGSAAVTRRQTRPGASIQRFVSTYEGNDPGIRNLLERIYLDNYAEPLPEFGHHVKAGVPRKRAIRTSFPLRERTPRRPEGTLIAHLSEHTQAINSISVSPDQIFFATASDDGTVKIWDTTRLERNVTSRSRHTYQQGGRVTCVCVLENSHCVASASDNGTILVHRVDVSLSGSLPKYGKQKLIRSHHVDENGNFATAMLHYATDTTSNLVYGTSQSTIRVLDLRTMRTLHTFQNPYHLGPITSLCLDRKHAWLLSGTLGGALTLWDLRFGLLLRTWRVGDNDSPAGRIYHLAIHPTKGKGRWVVVSFETRPLGPERSNTALEVWDVEYGRRVEIFAVAGNQGSATHTSPSSSSSTFPAPNAASSEPPSAASAIEAFLAEMDVDTSTSASTVTPDQQMHHGGNSAVDDTGHDGALFTSGRIKQSGPGVQAFLVGSDYGGKGLASAASASSPARRLATMPEVPIAGEMVGDHGVGGNGYFITAGLDRKIRFWDLGNVEHSLIISGLNLDEERPSYSMHGNAPTIYSERTSGARRPPLSKPPRATLIAQHQQNILRAHQDVISALAVVDLPFRCVVAASRDGIIRVYE